MTTIDPAGYSEAGAHLFTWLADKVLGNAKKAFGWGWERAEWAAAQDRYDEQIIKQYGMIRIFGQTTPKSLRGIFTDVNVLDQPTEFSRVDPAALTEHLWNEDRGLSFRHKERRPGEQLLNEGSKFFILGKPGAGKTTFLKHLAVREAQRGKWGPCLGKIPIFIPLKQFAEAGKPIFDFIVDEFGVCHFPDASEFVEKLLKSGMALVLFDGLDEVSKSEVHDRRGKVTETLALFTRQYNDCHFLITCRIAAVEYTFEPAFTYLEMADFAPDQVEAFVRAWFWDETAKDKGVALADGMLKEWERLEHAGIRDLGRNPLLLTLLCLNYADTLSFPTRRVEIYEEALDALLKKWDASRQIKRGSLYKTISLGRKRQMFARVAYDTLARNEIVFPQINLVRWLVEYLANVPEMPEAIDIDGEAFLREIVAQHGIFAQQAQRLFSFAHLSFQEYFSARYIADNAASGALDTLLKHITDDKWQEVFLLTASLLPDATAFLTSFEQALHRLAAGRPRLAAWLRWINTQAAASEAPYKRAATRVFYVRALADVRTRSGVRTRGDDGNDAFDHHSDVLPFSEAMGATLRENERRSALDRALDVALTLDVDLAFDVAIDLALTLDRDFVIYIDHGRNRTLSRAETMDHILDLCERQGRKDLHEKIAALAMPASEVHHTAWMHYVTELHRIIQAQGALTRYRWFEAEVALLWQKGIERWSLDDSDIDALAYYSNATWLFFNCLHVAYTPDRRAFEERIFLPPLL